MARVKNILPILATVLSQVLFFSLVDCFAGDYNTSPKIRINYLSQNSDKVLSFLGNQTHKDHFKLLRSDGVSLLIGARNVVYNLSLSDLSENIDQRITWISKDRTRELCLVKGKSEDECQNYIRVLAQTDPSNLLVCGTNSFNPRCRNYTTKKVTNKIEDVKSKTDSTKKGSSESAKTTVSKSSVGYNSEPQDLDENEEGKFRINHEFSGKGSCPHDPRHNSTAIFTGGQLYSGTVSDFSGSDALIFRGNLRTEQYDLKHLNAPDFVSSLEDKDHVYFFFREAAVEYINCGKSVYSRIARVCKNDKGGPHKWQNKWTTYIKTRLNCSVGGDFPFYFNEIQGTSSTIIDTPDGDKIIYGVFTTPENSMAGSAVCAFRLSDIEKSFNGQFKSQANSNANWLPVRDTNLPESTTRPGSCQADSTQLSESHLNFIKSHSLMDEAVDNIYTSPLYVKTSLNERLTNIAVDPNVRTPADDKTYDVMYVGTTKGKVLKVVNVETGYDINERSSRRKPVVIEEMQVFPYHVPVANVQVVQPKNSNYKKLIVLSDHEVKALPLHWCNAAQVQSCKACVALQDPHCAWNLNLGKCVDSTQFNNTDASALLQDLVRGKHLACSAELASTISYNDNKKEKKNKEKDTEISTNEILQDSDDKSEGSNETQETESQEEIDVIIEFNVDENEIPYAEGQAMKCGDEPYEYTKATVTTASLVTAFVALFVGFASGFITSRKCSKDGYRNCGHHYLENQNSINKSCESSALHHTESGYTSAPCNNHIAASTTSSTTSSNSTASSAVSNGSHSTNNGSNIITSDIISPTKTKNSNLLVNIQDKTEPEKNNLNTAAAAAAETSIIYNGTIPRNGTLCKKVYL